MDHRGETKHHLTINLLTTPLTPSTRRAIATELDRPLISFDYILPVRLNLEVNRRLR